MENKPFSIQSPEQIAKDYGGNKQKIAEAMQMGIVDPTAGTLAGMFIDRMRAAQMQEQTPQTTVAQQVFAPPQPPAPPQGMPQGGPPPAPGGLGATPEAAAMPQMAPQGEPQGGLPPMPEIPANPEEEAPAAYAAGGIAALQVPDAMFDEPDNGGYANGGIVAFADGGSWQRARVTSPYGAKRSYETHPGVDLGLPIGTPIGPLVDGVVVKAASDKVNGNHVIVRHPNGMTTSYLHLDKISVKPGQPVSASDLLGLSGNTGRSTGPHLHFGARDAKGNRIDPNILLKNPSMLLEGSSLTSEGENSDISSGTKRAANTLSLDESFEFGRKMAAATPEEQEVENQLRARYEEMRDPQYAKKEKNQNLGEFFLRAAAGVLGSKATNVWEAVGQSVQASMPDYFATEKERKALKDRALAGLADLGVKSRKRRLEAYEIGAEMYKAGLTADQAAQELLFREQQQAQNIAFQEKQLASQIAQQGLDRASAERIASMRTSDPNAFETKLGIIMKGNPGISPYQAWVLGQKQGLFGSAQNNVIPGMETGGNEGPQPVILGSRPA